MKVKKVMNKTVKKEFGGKKIKPDEKIVIGEFKKKKKKY